MPTIKRKVEMNLPQLIEWGWKNINKVQSEIFISNVSDFFGNYSTVHFSVDGYCFKTDSVSHKDTFTVEVEEAISEDTVIDNLIEINELIDFKKEGLLGGVRLYKNSSINQVENDKSVAYYIMNDDLEMTLIWKRKEGLVE